MIVYRSKWGSMFPHYFPVHSLIVSWYVLFGPQVKVVLVYCCAKEKNTLQHWTRFKITFGEDQKYQEIKWVFWLNNFFFFYFWQFVF